MNRVVVAFTVFVTLVLVEVLCASTQVHHNRNWSADVKKPVNELFPELWFGSRRYKRNLKDDLRPYTKEQLKTLVELLQESPWQNTVLEGKRQMNFTPRLGRDSDEDANQLLSAGDQWFQDPDLTMAFNAGDLMSQRSPPFAPRLGRQLVNQNRRYA